MSPQCSSLDRIW